MSNFFDNIKIGFGAVMVWEKSGRNMDFVLKLAGFDVQMK